MTQSYSTITKTLNSRSATKQTTKDPIAEVNANRASIIVDTEMEARAIAGNKNDPIDTVEEILEIQAKPS